MAHEPDESAVALEFTGAADDAPVDTPADAEPAEPVRLTRDEFQAQALEHLDAVYRIAYHLTRNEHMAQDLVQDVYLRAIRSAAKNGFESKGGGMRPWLFAIAHNTFYTTIKRENRAPTAVGEFHGDAGNEPMPDEPPPAWDGASFDWEHVDGRLVKAIEGIKEEYRQVLIMWGVQGLKYREIAEVLGVPIGTVMSRLHRARKLVSDKLMEDPDAAGELGLNRLAGPGPGA
ncbi:MAG: RNA polymerase sigma factor [Planctomycetota bacterium]